MDRVKLIILCGIPGCGKTSYGQKWVEENSGLLLSSDAIRKELYGDESTQGNPHEVFSLMQKRAVEALNNGSNVVYDATNITRKDRSGIVAACPKFVKIECHIIWTSIETCINRDKERGRTVGQAVIDKMLKRFQPPYYDEGIDDIRVIVPEKFNYDKYMAEIVTNLKIPHDNPHHSTGVAEHCIEAYEYSLTKLNCSDDVKAAAWLHDIGKPYTKAFIDSKGNECEDAHYYSHHNVGSWMSYGVCKKPYVAWLIGNHMEPFFHSKYYKSLPIYLKNDIDMLHEADVNAH